MVKSLDLIEEEYKDAFENLILKYREKLKNPKNHDRARLEFKKSLAKIIRIKDRESLDYIKKNKNKLLDFPEKKKEKIEKISVFHAEKFDFNPNLFERARFFLNLTFVKLTKI